MIGTLLRDKGLSNWESYGSSSLKRNVSKVITGRELCSPLDQRDFVCPASLAIGDVLLILNMVQGEATDYDDEQILMHSFHIP